MKQKDLALLAAVAVFSAIFSWIISSKVFVTNTARQQQVEVVDKLTTNFPLSDPRFFNKNSINPTKDSGLEATNENPFNGSTL